MSNRSPCIPVHEAIHKAPVQSVSRSGGDSTDSFVKVATFGNWQEYVMSASAGLFWR
jgi:hypothetical protein